MKRPVLLAGTSLLLLASGCGREGIRVYRVPKQAEAPRSSSTAAAQSPTAVAKPGIHWTAPPHWTEQPASQVRVGSFSVKGTGGGLADVSVIPFANYSGTELADVNRWRGQVGLEPVDEAGLPALFSPVEIDGRPAKLYNLAGTPPDKTDPVRMLVALSESAGTTWFFKMLGDDATVTAERDDFVAFLKSVHFHADDESEHVEPAPAEPAVAAAASSSQWKIPPAWSEASPGMMQQAKFIAKGTGDAQAEITLSVFPGQAGGLLPNVNRWRAQIQLPPVTDAELDKLVEKRDSPTGPMTVLDMKDANGGNRLVAAIVVRDGQSWYFKIKGDSGVIDRERAAFLTFAGQPQ